MHILKDKFVSEKFLLITVLAGFTVFSTIYSLYTPTWEESDGWFHWYYIKTLAEGNDASYYEKNQQPLYYVINAAFLSNFFNLDQFDDSPPHTKRNFYEDFNYFRHISKEDFPFGESNWNRGCVGLCSGLPEKLPYEGIALGVHSLRFFSIFCGLLSLIFIFKISKLVFPQNTFLSIYVVAFSAFIPQFTFINSVLASESLVITFSTITIYLLLLITNQPKQKMLYFLIPLFTGFALLTKVTSIFLVPLSITVFIYLLKTDQISKRDLLFAILVFTVIVLSTSGWWYLSHENPATRVVVRVYEILESNSNQTHENENNILVEKSYNLVNFERHDFVYFQSVWGNIGWKGVKTPPLLLDVIKILLFLSLTGFIVFLLRKLIIFKIQIKKKYVVVFALSIIFMLFATLTFQFASGSGTGRNLLSATSAFSSLFIIGFLSILSKSQLRHLLVIPIFILVLVNIVLFFDINEKFDHGLPRDQIYDANQFLRTEIWLGSGSAETESIPNTRIRDGFIENGDYDNFLLIHPPNNSPKWWNFTTTVPNKEYDLEASYGFLTNAVGRTDPVKFEIFIDDQKVLDEKKHYTGQVDKKIISLHKNVNEKIHVALSVDATEYGNYKAWSFFKLKYVR